jgi:hypothetical protein
VSKSQGDNSKNNLLRFDDIDVSIIEDKAGIHSTSDSTRQIERAQEKQVEATKGKQKGSWQIKEKSES